MNNISRLPQRVHQFHSSLIPTSNLILPFSVFVLRIAFSPDADKGETAAREGTRTGVFIEFPAPQVTSSSLSESSNSDEEDAVGLAEVLEENGVEDVGCFTLEIDDEPEEAGGEINADTKEFCISERRRDARF